MSQVCATFMSLMHNIHRAMMHINMRRRRFELILRVSLGGFHGFGIAVCKEFPGTGN